MAFRVRTTDGELTFTSYRELHNAFLIGLIDGEDEVLEEGTTRWRKASTLPLLKESAAKKRPAWFDVRLIFSLVLAVAALVLLILGKWGIALGVAIIASIGLIRLNDHAFRGAGSSGRPRR